MSEIKIGDTVYLEADGTPRVYTEDMQNSPDRRLGIVTGTSPEGIAVAVFGPVNLPGSMPFDANSRSMPIDTTEIHVKRAFD